MRLAPPHGAPLAVALLCLFTTPLIDRLDLQKLLIGVASVAALSLLALGRRLPPLPGLALLIPLSLGALIAPEATWARVEGWSLLVLGLGIFIFAATRPGAATRRGIARLAAILSLIAVAQALGAPFFNERLSFQGRGVVATLGNPGHLGAALAMALPFTAPDPRGRPGRGRLFGLTLAALILTGSRTAWVMAAPGLWCFWRGAGQGRARVALRAALLVAGLVALGGAALPQRAASAPGAAAGRLYLWRVHLSGLAELSPFGYGPEAFQRRWPARQRAYLAAQPQGTPRYTDLRHAHADLIELLDEVGLMGLLGLGWLAWRLERRAKAGRTARMAGAALAAGLIGGLAMPVLWTPSGLALLALAAGARWPISTGRRGGAAPYLALALLSLAALWPRARSEVARAALSLERAALSRGGEAARPTTAMARCHQALALDPRNPRAAIECARVAAIVGDEAAARAYFQRAALDLPTDGVLIGAGVGAGLEYPADGKLTVEGDGE